MNWLRNMFMTISNKPSNNTVILLQTRIDILELKLKHLQRRLDRLDPLGITRDKGE